MKSFSALCNAIQDLHSRRKDLVVASKAVMEELPNSREVLDFVLEDVYDLQIKVDTLAEESE